MSEWNDELACVLSCHFSASAMAAFGLSVQHEPPLNLSLSLSLCAVEESNGSDGAFIARASGQEIEGSRVTL